MAQHLRIILFDRHGNVIDRGVSSAVFPLTFVVKRIRARDLIRATNDVRQLAAASIIGRKVRGAALMVCPDATSRKSRHHTPTTTYMVSFAAISGKQIVVGNIRETSLHAATTATEDRVREIITAHNICAPSVATNTRH